MSLLFFWGASLVAYMVKNLPAVQETWIQSPGWEDPLEKGLATHSSILFFFLIYLFIGCDESLLICGLSLAVVSKVFSSLWRLLLWWSTGSGAHGLHAASRLSSCGGWAKLCLACGIFSDLVSNQCPLHCKVGS